MKAIKSIRTLIKLKKREIDAIVSVIANLEKTKSGLVNGLVKLRKDRDNEVEYQKQNHQIQNVSMLSNFLTQLKVTEKRLLDEIAKMDKLINEKREVLYSEFSELKKYEEALKNRIKKYEKELERKENARIDEFNTTKFLLEND